MGGRGDGLGGHLIDAVLDLAHDHGLERVTAHSSDRAVRAYARHGFGTSPRLLQADLTPSSRYVCAFPYSQTGAAGSPRSARARSVSFWISSVLASV
ncbi:GNAT family N-acetyltransferase [Streptomyces rimosus]